MLNINFLNKNITNEQTIELFKAVQYELADMNLAATNVALEKQNTIITNENGTRSEDDIKIAIIKRDKLEKEAKAYQQTKADNEEVYNSVIEVMSTDNEKGFHNEKDTVRTVLRVIACAENQKLYKYAIIPAFENADLYNALQTLHVDNAVTDTGYSTMSKERVAEYKKAQDELDNIMRETFSLSITTPYTEAIRVKLNAQDRKLIHDCYVKGFSNSIKPNKKDGSYTFKGRTINTAVKKDKKGNVDYSGLATDIAKIVIAHYSKIVENADNKKATK